MKYQIYLQIAGKFKKLPEPKKFQQWVTLALAHSKQKKTEIVIRIVNKAESAKLNAYYRHKQGPTNVLSFPFAAPKDVKSDLLGDLVICAPIVIKEAKEQNKALEAHWAHLVIHGVLHLLGYDHIKKRDAAKMENLEITLMAELDYLNPYQD